MQTIAKDISILACILHHQAARYDTLIKTLTALYAQSHCQFEVLLIDSSTDSQAQQALKKKFPTLIMQILPAPIGIVAGRNQGLDYFLQGQFQLLLILDNDIALNPNCLEILQKTLANNPDLGMVAPMLYTTQQILLSSGGDYYYALGQPRLRQQALTALTKNNDFLTGTIGLLRRELVQQLGYFDSIFDPYGFEDIDYCLRIKAAGFALAVNPEATAYHLTPFSFHTPTSHHLYYTTKNRILCARKHISAHYFYFLFLPWTLLRRGLYPGSKYLLTGRFDLFSSIFKAFVEALFNSLSRF